MLLIISYNGNDAWYCPLERGRRGGERGRGVRGERVREAAGGPGLPLPPQETFQQGYPGRS